MIDEKTRPRGPFKSIMRVSKKKLVDKNTGSPFRVVREEDVEDDEEEE